MKLTKNILIFGSAALVIFLTTLTQQCKAQAELHGSYVSDYVIRGVSRVDNSAQVKASFVAPVENKLLSVTNVYGTLLATRAFDGDVDSVRDLYAGTVLGTKLVQLDLGGRHRKTGDNTESELYAGVKLDVIGNPGVYYVRGTTEEFNAYELRVSEAIKWGFLPEELTTQVSGLVGNQSGPVSTSYYEAYFTVNYALKETTELFAGIGYAGTSAADYDNNVVYTAGVNCKF